MGLFKNMKDAMSGAGTGAMTMPSMDDVSAVNAQGQEYRRLSQVGRSGNAVITSATDSGERAAGNTVADLEMQVTPEGGDSYPVTLRYIIAGQDLGPYAPGASYSVKIDPETPERHVRLTHQRLMRACASAARAALAPGAPCTPPPGWAEAEAR